MFEDSLVERRIAGGQRHGWATIVAFLLEAALVRTLVLIPLVFTDALPVRKAVTGTGTIVGQVTDPSGAVVPKATVTLTNAATGSYNLKRTADDPRFYTVGHH